MDFYHKPLSQCGTNLFARQKRILASTFRANFVSLIWLIVKLSNLDPSMNPKGASQPEPQPALFAAIDPILGYLNYGNGSFDARFFQNLNTSLLGYLVPDADTVSQIVQPRCSST